MKLKTSLQLSAIFPIVFAIVMVLILAHRSDLYTTMDLVFVISVGLIGLFMTGVILTYSKDILNKIKILNDWINAILKGNLDQPVGLKPTDDEVGRLSFALSKMLAELKSAYSELHKEAITNKKSAEEHKQRADMSTYGVKQLTEALNKMKDSQRDMVNAERMRVLEQVTRGVSHDFSEAITPILGAAELMKRDPSLFAEKQKAEVYLGMIMASVDKARKSIANLAGFFHVSRERSGPADVSKAIKEAVGMTEPYWRYDPEQNNPKLDVRTSMAMVPTVAADPAALRDALASLIINSIDSIPAGTKGVIELSCSSDGKIVSVEVKDNGCGMSPDVLKHCVEPFFTTKSGAGAGMGLTTANSIVRRYGGTVQISSRVQEGTTVRCLLPVWVERTSSGAEQDHGPAKNLKGLSILLVDDDPGCREIMAQAMSLKEHKVDTVASGQDGLLMLKDNVYDVIVVDRAMPTMSGDEFVRQVRKTKHAIPIIMLTGFGSIMKEEDDIPAGISLLLSKPAGMDEIDAAIRKVIKDNVG